jgi:OmpA-OmpF porin, OOP family
MKCENARTIDPISKTTIHSTQQHTIKMNKPHNLLTALLLCGSCFTASAQRWSCAAQVGTTAYLGDVNERLLWQPKLNRVTVGGSIGYEALDFLTLRLNVAVGQLSGSDAENTNTSWRKLRAFSFQTPFIEASLLTEWDVLKAMHIGQNSDNTNPFSAHLLLGVGVNRINPIVDFNEPNPVSELTHLDKNAAFNHNQIVIPYGLVVKWHINETSTIRVEAAMRKTFSDYFDGISKSASPNNNDAYIMGSIGWEQTLSWGLHGWEKMRFTSSGAYCPRF